MVRLLVLLLLAGAVFSALWWTDREPEQPTILVERVLDGRSLLASKRIVMRYDLSLAPIELERQGVGGRFRIVEPLVDDASTSFLYALAGAYDSAVKRLVTPSEDVTPEVLERLELDPGRASFSVEWPDGAEVEILFGGRGVFGDGVSALIDGSVWQVSTALVSTITANTDGVRSTQVFRTTADEAQRLVLRKRRDDGGEDVSTLVRRPDGFRLLEDEDLELDSTLVQATVDAILSLPVGSFVSGRARVGARLPSLIVEVDGPYGHERLDAYFDDGGQLYGHVTPRGLEFTADPARYVAALSVPIERMRTRFLFPLPMLQDLEAITVAPPASTAASASDAPILTLKRNALEEFRILSPMVGTTDPTAVAELLAGLRKVVVQRYVEDGAEDLSRYGLDSGYLTVRLDSRYAQFDPVELHVGARDGELSYVRRADSRNVVALDNAAVDPLRRDWTAFVSREVLRLRVPREVSAIVCTSPGGREVAWEREDGGIGWIPRGADDAETDVDVADAFDAVRDLIATDVRARSAFDAAMLARPATFRFEAAGGRVLAELELYRDANGRPWIGVPGRPVLYEKGYAGKALATLVPED